MKQLCVSAMFNRIYDSAISKRNPNLMVGKRTDRTDEVVNTFVRWFNIVDYDEQQKVIKELRIKSKGEK